MPIAALVLVDEKFGIRGRPILKPVDLKRTIFWGAFENGTARLVRRNRYAVRSGTIRSGLDREHTTKSQRLARFVRSDWKLAG